MTATAGDPHDQGKRRAGGGVAGSEPGDVLRILIVDDDPDALAVMELVIRSCGLAVAGVADTAPAAIEAYRRLVPHPDLVVVDLDLGPEGTGLDVIRAIRAVSSEQPVVLRSSNLDDADIRAANALGATGTMTKDSIDDLRDLFRVQTSWCG